MPLGDVPGMKPLIGCCLLALVALPVSAQDRPFRLGLWTYAGAATLDAWTTVACHEAHTCVEVNPLLRPLVARHGVQTAMAVKLALQAGLAGVLIAERSRHPRGVAWMLATLTVGQVYVDYRNARLLHRRRR